MGVEANAPHLALPFSKVSIVKCHDCINQSDSVYAL